MSSNVRFPGHVSRSHYSSNVGKGNSKPDFRGYQYNKVNDEARKHIETNGRYQEARARLQRKIEQRNANADAQLATVQTLHALVTVTNNGIR